MDKYEFNIKVEQIKKLVNKKDFATAMKISDTIDWRRVRNANLLSMISQVYEKNGEFQEAKEVLLLAFERAPIGKRLLYKLTELALKEGSVGEAEDYYREFCDLAPEDTRQHILRYLILKEKDAPVDQLIHAIERYVNVELDEKWMYELAELYAQAGRAADCVQLCDKMILLFGIGTYVERATDLKQRYAPANVYQKKPSPIQSYGPSGGQSAGALGINGGWENPAGSYGSGQNYGTESEYGTGGGYGTEPGYATGGSYGAEGGYVPGGGYGAETGYVPGGGYGAEAGYGAGGTYGTEAGYGAGGSYGTEAGYGAEGSYGTEGGYVPGGNYGAEAGYVPGGGYEAEAGYGAEGSYNGEGGFIAGGNYGGTPGFGAEGSYRAEAGPGTEGNYKGEPGYRGGESYRGEPGYAAGENYGGERGYSTGRNYGDERVYNAGGNYGGHPGYGARGYGGGQDYDAGEAYGAEAGYGAEGNYEAEADYSSEGAYGTGYGSENEYRGESGYPLSSPNYEGAGGNYENTSGYGTAGEYDNNIRRAARDFQAGRDYGTEDTYRKNIRVYRENPVSYDPEVSYDNEDVYENEAGYGIGEDYNGNAVYETESDYGRDESYSTETWQQEEEVPQMRPNSYNSREYGYSPAGPYVVDEELMANLHQAAAEKELAAEMSRISTEEYMEPEPESNRTRVFRGKNNVRVLFPKVEEEKRYYSRSYMLHHMIIEAQTAEEGIGIAIEALKKVHQETGMDNPVIKISGSKLSSRGIFNVSDKLAGKDLIVEEAGDLTQRDLEELQMLLERDETGMIVVLIDNPFQIEELHQQNPGFINLFKCIGLEKDKEEPIQVPEQNEEFGQEEADKQDEPERPEIELKQAADTEDETVLESKPAVEPEDEREPEPEAEADRETEAESGLPEESESEIAEDVEPDEIPGDSDREEEPDEYQEEISEAEEDYDAEEDSEEEYSEEEYSEEPYPDEEYDASDEDGEDFQSEDELYDENFDGDEYEDGDPVDDDEELEIDVFADYAAQYANEIDCSITGKSMLALYERVEAMEENGIPLTRANAEDMIEEAADKAEKPSIGGLIKGVFSSKYDKEGLLILKEEHFK